jgi:hypothetical protein
MNEFDLPLTVEVERSDGTHETVRIVRVAPVAPAGTVEDLEYIAARARRTLADPSKSKWHSQERDLLNRVEHELQRVKAKSPPAI